jgi:hypothetical protein
MSKVVNVETLGETMSKVINVEVEVPPTHGDGSGQTPPMGVKNSSNPDTPRGSNVDELTFELMQHKLQIKMTSSRRSLSRRRVTK